MKKYILIIMMVVTIFLSGCNDNKANDDNLDNTNETNNGNNGTVENNDYSDKHKVNFYLFYSSSCDYCHEEREWISSIKDDYPYVNFIMYEVSEYGDLFEKVTAAYGSENTLIPVTIIGNNYMIGYSESKNRKFIRYIEELSQFESCDVVETIKNNGDVEACMAKNEK